VPILLSPDRSLYGDVDSSEYEFGLDSFMAITAVGAEAVSSVTERLAGQHSFECVVKRLISGGDVEHAMRGALVVQEVSQ